MFISMKIDIQEDKRMQKGYKRSNKGMAVLWFFICLITLILVLFAGWFCLTKLDYSDKLADPSVSMRPYVEMTASPDEATIGIIGGSDGPTAIFVTGGEDDMDAAVNAAVEMDPGFNAGDETFVDLTVTPTPEPTAVPTPTPEPTPIPTATPVPTPTPEPTPTPTPTPKPTKIPSKKFSSYRKSGFNVPDPSTSATVEMTKLYVSEPNANSVIQVGGYGYINDASFDGSTATIFLIVTSQENGKQIAYKGKMEAGSSGADHTGALCKNPEATDFEATLSVKQFADGGYDLGIILYYKLPDGNTAYSYHELGESIQVEKGAVVQAEEEGFAGFADTDSTPFVNEAAQQAEAAAPAAEEADAGATVG